MTVKELIEWLKTQDQEAIVEVVVHKSGDNYYEQGGNAVPEEFTADISKYIDWRKNPHVEKNEKHYRKRTLLLGEINGDS